MKPAAFIFDLDGTLIDSGLDIALAANHVRGHFQLPGLPIETVIGYVGDGVATLLERVLGHDTRTGQTGPGGLSVQPKRVAEGLTVFAEHYGSHLLDNTTLYAGVLDTLALLTARPCHLATNKPRSFTDPILAGLGLAGVFDQIVAGDEAPVRKPDPAHLAACLRDPEVSTSRVVVVGDSPNDVRAARGLGAVAVGCIYGLTPAKNIRAENPDHVIAEFGELAGLFSL